MLLHCPACDPRCFLSWLEVLDVLRFDGDGPALLLTQKLATELLCVTKLTEKASSYNPDPLTPTITRVDTLIDPN
jgi:hypothetical protein